MMVIFLTRYPVHARIWGWHGCSWAGKLCFLTLGLHKRIETQPRHVDNRFYFSSKVGGKGNRTPMIYVCAISTAHAYTYLHYTETISSFSRVIRCRDIHFPYAPLLKLIHTTKYNHNNDCTFVHLLKKLLTHSTRFFKRTFEGVRYSNFVRGAVVF